MLRNLLLTIGFILSANLVVFSQSGALKGKIFDKETKEPIPFANIVMEVGGTMSGGATSDFDGNFTIKPIAPGTYDLKATYVGYKTVIVKGMVISSDQINFFDIEMASSAQQIEEFVVSDYAIPLIDKDKTVSGGSVTAEDIKKMPNRNANSIATTIGGVFSADGERGNVRGARSDQTIMFIDGIRVMGSSSLPQSAIEQVSVYLGGLPAQYGDARGGIINVTTKGPSRTFGAGVELETSKYLDKFGHSRVGLNLQGPLIKGKKEAQTALLGYFLSGEFNYQEDSRPTANGVYVATDEYLNLLQQYPLRPSGLEGGGTYTEGEFTRMDNLEVRKATPNTNNMDVNVSGKIDVRTSQNTTLTFGGQLFYDDGKGYSFGNSMFNYERNLRNTRTDWRAFGRFTQRFPSDAQSTSVVKNVYYSLQFDYSQSQTRSMDPDHKEDLFKYGYLGKYTTYKTSSYARGSIEIDGVQYNNINILDSWDNDTAYIFDAKGYNPYLARYTSMIYDFFPDKTNNWENEDQLTGNGGLLNGDGAGGFYGLWNAPGIIQGRYGETFNTQVAFNASAAADIGNHEIKFGFIYEQRSQRGYDYNSSALWSRMRALTNFHITELDTDNPIPIYGSDGTFSDTVIYYRRYTEQSQFRFDKSLRQKLGLDEQGLDFILVDSYDYDNNTIQYYDKDGVVHVANVDGDLYDITMFNADELLDNGNYVANYYGFDHTGKKLNYKPTLDDFFTKTDDRGDLARPIAAYEPIYMAGYIQDKFAFNDLIFNVGVRVDRFDANQPVLKDPFLLYEAHNVSYVKAEGLEGQPIDVPGNMGDDYVVYVNDAQNPTRVMGYRNEFTWFNSDGVEINDPEVINAGSGVSPYLVDKNQDEVNSSAFQDYEPQVSIMPRISFSFPISDEALFYAHYDVLTQRPLNNVFSNPADYYFINSLGGARLNNPNLQPTKTIDYEIGFQQKLTNRSSLKLTAFYKENRDDIQAYRYSGAYPRSYTSYNNIDFGTVKGLTVTYDLRQVNSNIRMNASYTLQFADGTGSGTTTSVALINSGLPNLRTTNPLNWDRRHNLAISFDFRYKEGKEYNGPTITRHKGTENEKAVQLLKNMGVNFQVTGGSGTPYTAQSNITRLTGGRRDLDGTINGSRLPWQFRVGMRLNKDIYLNSGSSSNRETYLNIYLQVLNLLNTKNVLFVYSATGVPDDDGYLAAAEWQNEINQQIDPQSYRTLYGIAVNNPGNYSSPRQIRIGVALNF